ncbi:MAG: NrsF family protein [Xanthobacteraceae bacterium]
MIRFDSSDRLVQALSADLAPVHRLAPPILRALTWLAIVAAAALALAMVADVGAMTRRLMAAPDLWLAAMGSVLTAVLAALAAFELSLPDRKVAWALLPLPALLLWIGASGMGCLRTWSVAETSPMPPDQVGHCLIFILGFSLPLSLLLIVMLRRGFSLRPKLTAVIGGLACASAAATLLNFVHPYDAAATDLAVHGLAVTIVILANILFGGRLLSGEMNRSGFIG